MIVLSNVSKCYVTQAGEVKALQNVSLSLPERGLVFFVGRSGSGKTTLLDLLGGLSEPTEGSISFGEKPPTCGYVFQDIGLFPYLTAEENVRFAGASKARARELLSAVGMEEYAARRTRTLSGGEQQRVAVARMLVKKPDLVLADEPTGALDEENAKAVFALLKELSYDRLVLVVTHDEESAEAFGDILYHIDGGEVSLIFDRLSPFAPSAPSPLPEEKEERGAGGSLAALFSFRRMAASKFKNALFVLLLFLLLTVLFTGVSVLSASEALVTWRYAKSHDVRYLTLQTGDPEADRLYPFEQEALEENANCLYVITWQSFDREEAGIADDLSDFVPLAVGTYEGAVLVTSSPETVALGQEVHWGGLILTVTGAVHSELLPKQLQSTLPSLLFESSLFVPGSVKSNRLLRAVVDMSSVNYTRFERLMGEYGMHARSVDWVQTEETSIEIGEFIRYGLESAEALRIIFLAVGALLLVCTMLYAVWFMGDNIRSDRRSVGIMKSLGKTEKEIASVYLLQAGMLFLTALVLSCFGTAAFLVVLDDLFALSMGIDVVFFLPEFWYLLLLAAVLLVLFAAVLLPLRLIKKVQIGILLRSI